MWAPSLWDSPPIGELPMRPRSPIMLTAALLLGCTPERATPPGEAHTVLLQQEQQPGYAASRIAAPQAYKAALTDVDEVRISTLPDVASNMIIRTATASVEVDSLEPAVARVKELALRL